MNPSLLLIPDRYKAAKLYSQIPDSGAGDLTFARNSNATRVNSAGLIEKVRTNVITFSEQFDNAAWDKSNCTISSNVITAPDGTSTADKLILNNGQSGSSGDGTGLRQLVDIASNNYTLSIFAKAGEFSTIRFRENQVTGAFLTINLLNGAITNGDSNQFINPKTELYANGWYRISFQTPTLTAIYKYSIRVSETGNGTSGIYIWGAQLETGDIATDYIPTTTAAVSVGITADIPRLDYTGGGCPSLLLEPQRTNIALYSEQFDNAGWNKNNLTITANNLVSPDGYTNADTAFETAFDGFHDLLQSPSLTSATTYTLSSFVKAAGRDYCYLFLSDGTTPAAVKFNLATGAVLGTALGSPVSSKIENYGNGWYRCSIVYTSAATATGTLAVSATNSPALSLSGYAGDITKGIAVYGAQLEAGSYPTSYIPTLGSSVTRLADAASKTGISSLIGQSEGSIYWEGVINGIPVDQTIFGVEKESSNFVIRFGGDGTSIYAQSYNGSTNLFFQTTTPSVGQKIKLAFAYKAGDYAFYKNGTLVASGTNASTIPACDKLQTNQLWSTAGGIGAYGTNDAAIYTTRLSNAQLQSLTAL